MNKVEFSPSLMTMDLDKFKQQITFLNDHVASYHIDIMDGHYVPNITLSPWFIEELRKNFEAPSICPFNGYESKFLGTTTSRYQM